MSEQATLAQALLAAQKEMPAVKPDATNPHFKSQFVSLGHLLAKVRPVLNKHGLVLIQAPVLTTLDGAFVLTTTIMHSSGQSISFDAPLNPTKNDPQGQGSAITYMRRYALASALAIADQEDDDGNSGSAPDERGFEQLLKDAGGSKAAIGAIGEYTAAKLTPTQFAAAERGLRDSGKAAEFLGRLESAASEFAEQAAA